MVFPSSHFPGFFRGSDPSTQPHSRKAQGWEASGFSLMELMVAMLIIAVLALISIAAGNKVIYSAKKSKSINNLRTMSPALVGYVTDNNGRLPHGAHLSSTVLWYNALDRYLTNTDTTWPKTPERPMWQRCPAKVFKEWGMSAGRAVSVGYGWNHSYFGYTSESIYRSLGWMSRMSEVDVPSQTIIIGTSRDSVDPAHDLAHVLIYPKGDNMAKRFDGGGLYLFLDGHVQWLRPEDIAANNNHFFRKKKLQ